jgi:O-antigen biosynthesis protein
MSTQGFIDFYGFHPVVGGWFFCGWLPVSGQDARNVDLQDAEFSAQFESGRAATSALVVLFDRGDLGDRGTGFVLFMNHSGRFRGPAGSAELRLGKSRFPIEPAGNTIQLRDTELVGRVRGVIAGGFAGHHREISALLSRRGYNGVDTLNSLSEPIRIGLDEAIVCKPDGIVLLGWCIDEHDAIASLSLYVGGRMTEIDRKAFVRVDRQDVMATVGKDLGSTNSRCGFVSFVPATAIPNDLMYLQVETRAGEVGFLGVPSRRLSGMAAIRHIVDTFRVQYGDVRPAYDQVIGPSLHRLNAERLRVKPQVSEAVFGSPPDAPIASVIVPLYGRIDYLECPLGLMSAHTAARKWDIIYVLDDPPKRQEAEALAESAFARFGVPFRLLLLNENVGFAPANNVGLAHARGKFVCFLNSDVFPGTPDWMDRLCADLQANRDIGIVGALLVFEDGSIQHQGMVFEPIPMMGGYRFPIHMRKGRRPQPDGNLQRQAMITGACMVMRRKLAEKLGGFDEGYVIGDFEDCDLCAKARVLGLTCAVDHRVRLYHIERRSQARPDQPWRQNLTLYNAWRYESCWFSDAQHAAYANG